LLLLVVSFCFRFHETFRTDICHGERESAAVLSAY